MVRDGSDATPMSQPKDPGRSGTWRPLTRDSTVDNLQPIVTRSAGRDELLLWA